MKPQKDTIDRIKQELETITRLLENPEAEVVDEVLDRLEKLTYELEMLAKSAGDLETEEAKNISDYVDTVQAELGERVKAGNIPKETTESLFSMFSRLNNITALLGYFLK